MYPIRIPSMKIAFSTIACPQWTLAQASNKAAEYGYLGLEMRSFHDHRDQICSDPFNEDPEAIRAIFDDAGIEPVSLATSVRYDKPISPPIIGRIFQDEESGVSDTKAYVDLADRAGIGFVRVFGCHLQAGEPQSCSMSRITDRLRLAGQTARNTSVRLLIENADSFTRGEDLIRLIDRVDSQWLSASYNILASHLAGEHPVDGIRSLGDALRVVKVSDVDHDGQPTVLGDGVIPVRETINALCEMNFQGWVVYEYPKLWQPDLGSNIEGVLRHASDTLYEWMRALPSAC